MKRRFFLFLAMILAVSVLAVSVLADDPASGAEAVYVHPTDGTRTETSFAKAVVLVNRNYGGSITLMKDVRVTSGELTFNYGCVVDLGGHELYTAGGTMLMGFSAFRTDEGAVLDEANNHGTDAQKILKFLNGTIKVA